MMPTVMMLALMIIVVPRRHDHGDGYDASHARADSHAYGLYRLHAHSHTYWRAFFSGDYYDYREY